MKVTIILCVLQYNIPTRIVAKLLAHYFAYNRYGIASSPYCEGYTAKFLAFWYTDS